MTVAELDLWAVSHDWGRNRRSALAEYLERFVIRHSTRDLCQAWARVTDETRRRGRPISAADASQAAVALSAGTVAVVCGTEDGAIFVAGTIDVTD